MRLKSAKLLKPDARLYPIKRATELLEYHDQLLRMKKANALGKVFSDMSEQSGRLEKRVHLTINLEISNLLDPSSKERASTENISSLGMRVMTQTPKALNECLVIRTIGGDLRAVARVIYCQQLANERFGVGVLFLRLDTEWNAYLKASESD